MDNPSNESPNKETAERRNSNSEWLPNKCRITKPPPPKPAANPLQFIKVAPSPLFQKAHENLKKAEEIKTQQKCVVKDDAEEWQQNLDNWKSSRRKRQGHIIERVVEVKKLEQEGHERNRRKSKTFNEILEDRNKRGHRLNIPIYDEDSNDLSDYRGSSKACSYKDVDTDDSGSCLDDKDLGATASDSQSSGKDISSVSNQSQSEDELSFDKDSTKPDEDYTYQRAIEDYRSKILPKLSDAEVFTNVKKPAQETTKLAEEFANVLSIKERLKCLEKCTDLQIKSVDKYSTGNSVKSIIKSLTGDLKNNNVEFSSQKQSADEILEANAYMNRLNQFNRDLDNYLIKNDDSGIHTADVSCSVSQADESVEYNDVIPSCIEKLQLEQVNNNCVPSFEDKTDYKGLIQATQTFLDDVRQRYEEIITYSNFALAPANVKEPPKEKPPPPPLEDKLTSLRRIKKEADTRRSSFLGLETDVMDIDNPSEVESQDSGLGRLSSDTWCSSLADSGTLNHGRQDSMQTNISVASEDNEPPKWQHEIISANKEQPNLKDWNSSCNSNKPTQSEGLKMHLYSSKPGTSNSSKLSAPDTFLCKNRHSLENLYDNYCDYEDNCRKSIPDLQHNFYLKSQRKSMPDIQHLVDNKMHKLQLPVEHRKSMPDLQKLAIPPGKPLRDKTINKQPDFFQYVKPARPLNVKRSDNRQMTKNYSSHWLYQEAELKRLADQKVTTPKWSYAEKRQPEQIIGRKVTDVERNSCARLEYNLNPDLQHSSPNRLHPSGSLISYPHLGNSEAKILSVSGKKKCSLCGNELGRGAAMIIETLCLFYHMNCFKCCVCHIPLGDGLMGIDVRVRNEKLHCHNCYTSDDGVKFSCV